MTTFSTYRTRTQTRWRRALGVSLVIAGTLSARAQAGLEPRADAVVQVSEDASGQVLAVETQAGSVVIRRSTAPILDPRVTEGAGGVRFATWREGSSADLAYTATSRDGGRNWTRPREVSYRIRTAAGSFLPGESGPALPEALRAEPHERIWIVQFHVAGVAAFRERVAELGGEIVGHYPGQAHLVRMSAGNAERVRGESFVRWIGRYEPGFRLEAALLAELGRPDLAPGDAPRRYVIQTYTRGIEEKSLVAEQVLARGGELVAATPNGFLLEARLDLGQLAALAHSDHVLWIQLWTPPEPDMDLVRNQTGADFIETLNGYSGQGVRGEVMDGGVQQTHQDFDGIILHGTTGVDNHGTCTYGIVFGNGARDGDGNAQGTGMLPSAQGYFASYNSVTDRHQHTAEIVTAPINGVFQSNSWGGGRTRAYDAVSADMDDIIWLYDFPILQSQSNAGNQDSRPQAWAKNIVSVGAVNHYDTLALTDDCWCGGASIGPAADGSIKPDIAHWYDREYTTDVEPGGYVPNSFYEPAFGGTSGATPIVAGVTGLILQMWADNLLGNNPPGTTVFQKRPHAATTKALLINTAEQYPFSGANHDLTRTHQGWGLANARRFFERAPQIKVINETSVLREGEFDSYQAMVPAGQAELKVTMVYMDRPGTPGTMPHRVNDVTLRVTSPSGAIYWGNYSLDVEPYSRTGGAPDTLNTVENVFIQNPMPGSWQVDVFADEINQDVHAETPGVDQDYALVVWPATSLVSCGASIPVPTSVQAQAQPAPNTVRVTWTGSTPSYKVYRSQGGCAGPFVLAGTVSAPQTSFTDTGVSGGISYGYVVRGSDGCDSADSTCVTVMPSGPCLIQPGFPGLTKVSGVTGSVCGIALQWPSASTTCGGPVRYNVYRSTNPTFVPGATNRVATCLTANTHTDRNGLAPGTTYHYVVRAEDLAGQPGGPCGGLEETNTSRLSALPVRLILRDEFEAGLGAWLSLKGTPPATTGDWIVGDPIGTTAQPEDDATPDGTQCLYTAANPGAALGVDDVDAGEVVAISPVFDLAGLSRARLTLSRWHFIRDLNADAGDYYALDLSNNSGASWTNLETLDNTTSAPSWTRISFDLDQVLPLTATMQFRVRSADGAAAGNIVETAIDDVDISSLDPCTPAAGLPGVVRANGSVRAPLLAVKDIPGFRVRFHFGQDCGVTTQYGLYQGDIGVGQSSLAALAGMCSIGASSADIANDAATSHFYLVAPNDGVVEGSLGVDRGVRRVQPATFCFPRANPLDGCAP